MSSQPFGASVLDKHGRGKLSEAQKDVISTELRKEFLREGAVGISNEVLEKEISRFLEFGYASENNLDRLRRRVMTVRPPGENGRSEDAMSLRTVGSIAYSSPTRVGKQCTDTPVPQLFSITDGMKSQHDWEKGTSKSARKAAQPEPEQLKSPGSARSARSAQSARTSSSAGNNGCKWSTVAKLNALREVQEADTKKSAIKEKQLTLKGFLDEQVAAKSSTTQQKAEESRNLRIMVDTDYERLQEEDAQKKKQFQHQVKLLKDEREEQVLCAHMVRDQERKEALEAGKKLAQQANNALKAEQNAALDKKDKEKKLMTKLIVEWGEEKAESLEKKEKVHLAEKQAVLKLQEELRREEEVKQAENRKSLEARDEQFAQLAIAEANARSEKKTKREARIREENKQLEGVNKANADAAERDRQKNLNKRAERVKNVEFLFEQMGERQCRKNAEVDQKQELLNKARSFTVKNAQDERQKHDKKRSENVQHRVELQQQIESRVKAPARVREDLMSTSEAFINKNLVGEAGDLGLF